MRESQSRKEGHSCHRQPVRNCAPSSISTVRTLRLSLLTTCAASRDWIDEQLAFRLQIGHIGVSVHYGEIAGGQGFRPCFRPHPSAHAAFNQRELEGAAPGPAPSPLWAWPSCMRKKVHSSMIRLSLRKHRPISEPSDSLAISECPPIFEQKTDAGLAMANAAHGSVTARAPKALRTRESFRRFMGRTSEKKKNAGKSSVAAITQSRQERSPVIRQSPTADRDPTRRARTRPGSVPSPSWRDLHSAPHTETPSPA